MRARRRLGLGILRGTSRTGTTSNSGGFTCTILSGVTGLVGRGASVLHAASNAGFTRAGFTTSGFRGRGSGVVVTVGNTNVASSPLVTTHNGMSR